MVAQIGHRNASVKDVASAAGVSLGTVSNVLNRPELVAHPPAPASSRPSRTSASCAMSPPASCGPDTAGRSPT